MVMNSLLNSLPLWAALLPLGLYLLTLGGVHLRRRPVMVSGAWDGVLLAASVAGLVVVGPLALVQPAAGRSLWSWPMLLVVFSLFVALCLLVSRPRVVIYNITVDQLRPLVAEAVSALDPAARWAGESVALPTRGLQLHIDGNGSMRSVNVIAVGERTSLEGWTEFCRRLRRSVGRLRVRTSPWGPVFAGAGLCVLAFAAWFATRPPLSAPGAAEGQPAPSATAPPTSKNPGASDAGTLRPVGA
jgi:hypothetical protein